MLDRPQHCVYIYETSFYIHFTSIQPTNTTPSTMADTQAFSRFPLELIENIIMNTEDLFTLCSWRRTCKDLRDLVNRHPTLIYTLCEGHLRASDRSKGKISGIPVFTSDSACYRKLCLDFRFGGAPFHNEVELMASQAVKAKLSILMPSETTARTRSLGCPLSRLPGRRYQQRVINAAPVKRWIFSQARSVPWWRRIREFGYTTKTEKRSPTRFWDS